MAEVQGPPATVGVLDLVGSVEELVNQSHERLGELIQRLSPLLATTPCDTNEVSHTDEIHNLVPGSDLLAGTVKGEPNLVDRLNALKARLYSLNNGMQDLLVGIQL